MRKLALIILVLIYNSSTWAQVGIGNTNPNATLDISASNVAIPSNTDGILVPRVDNFPVTSPTASQNGMLVFVTGNGTPTKGFYYWDQYTTSWIGIVSTNTTQHYIGELFGGGIVYYVYNNGANGLIASLNDLDGGSGTSWGTGVSLGANDYYNGAANTTTIVTAYGVGTYAAKLCDDYSNGGFTDWYLPSLNELKEIDNALLIINSALTYDGDTNTNPINTEFNPPLYGRYWSSTEDGSNATRYFFGTSTANISNKFTVYRVRAVRAF